MTRPRSRCRLESGLRLDLNRLARLGIVKPGARTVGSISWSRGSNGEELASGTITADMSCPNGMHGTFRIQIGSLNQHIHLSPFPRHFGGLQWYFLCPHTGRRVSVLWMPPGAQEFSCRRRWGRQVAYKSQCLSHVDRLWHGRERIKGRLCLLGGLDPDDWMFPPKPKWMRWSTYYRAQERLGVYDTALDSLALRALTRRLAR